MVSQGDVQCFAASIALTYAKPHAKRRSLKMTDVLIIASVSAEKKGKVLEGHSETGTRAGDWNVLITKFKSWRSWRRTRRAFKVPAAAHLPSLQGVVG